MEVYILDMNVPASHTTFQEPIPKKIQDHFQLAAHKHIPHPHDKYILCVDIHTCERLYRAITITLLKKDRQTQNAHILTCMSAKGTHTFTDTRKPNRT